MPALSRKAHPEVPHAVMEYAVIFSLIVVAVIAVILLLGTGIAGFYNAFAEAWPAS